MEQTKRVFKTRLTEHRNNHNILNYKVTIHKLVENHKNYWNIVKILDIKQNLL